MKKTLKQFIVSLGPSKVADDLGVTSSYVSRISHGSRRISIKVLNAAVAKYGAGFDIEGTLREMRQADMASVSPAEDAA